MKILHIVPGESDISNGMAVVARMIANEQGNAEVVDSKGVLRAIAEKDLAELWIHGMWLPIEWFACWRAHIQGKRFVRMTHGSLSPLYLKYKSPFKKWLVGPIERFCLRRCTKIVATCEAEKGWIEAYLGKVCPPVEVTDIKRFFNLSTSEAGVLPSDRPLHLLYLGRRHPLKGLKYLEEALRELQEKDVSVIFRVVSNAFGEEKEKVWEWCDVLVLPTLSDNFGLVIAEALERGKRVITTDGAPAWGDGNDYGGRLVYLKGYRDGTPNTRVHLLEDAIIEISSHMLTECSRNWCVKI